MKVETTFDLNDKVKILPLDFNGKVVSICIDSRGTRYNCKYYVSGKAEYEYFDNEELEKLKDIDMGLGFANN